LDGPLWQYNLAKVVVVDVTDDYELMQPAMPGHCYPVLYETYIPLFSLKQDVANALSTDRFLYDWHEQPTDGFGEWYVGVVEKSRVAIPS
jgi:hypothetical protein